MQFMLNEEKADHGESTEHQHKSLFGKTMNPSVTPKNDPPPPRPSSSSDIVSPPLPLHPLSDPKIQASSCNERGVIFPQSLRTASASKHQLFQLSLTFTVIGWPKDQTLLV